MNGTVQGTTTPLKQAHNTQRERLKRLHARGFPAWLIARLNALIMQTTCVDDAPFPITWLVDPRRCDATTVRVRYHVIATLLREIMQRRLGNGKHVFMLRKQLAPDVIKDFHWNPISRPSMAALLGMDQSSITLAIQRMAKAKESCNGGPDRDAACGN